MSARFKGSGTIVYFCPFLYRSLKLIFLVLLTMPSIKADAESLPISSNLSGLANTPTFIASSDSLCSKNQLPVFAITTEDFDAKICATVTTLPPNDIHDECDAPSEPYFYVGQSRKTAQSIVLPAHNATQKYPFIMLYKAKNGNVTYQMASSGEYANKKWTSLSIFENGKITYYQKINKYDGFYDC